VISGIIPVLKSAGRRVDAPGVHGPSKTLYHRFVRWAAKGVWSDIFHQVADCTAGNLLLEQMPDVPIVKGDKGHDSDAIRRQVEERGAMSNIPPKPNRRWKNCFSPSLYRGRNAIERMFCRLKRLPPRRRCTSAVSPQGMTAWPLITLPPSVSRLPCATGYESGP